MSTLVLLEHKVRDNVERSHAAREWQGLAPEDFGCLVSKLELFPVDSPMSRGKVYTEIDVVRLHFRSASGSCVEEDDSKGTELETHTI